MSDGDSIPREMVGDVTPGKPHTQGVSPIARQIGRLTLRAMRYPGRKWLGGLQRKRSMLRGGRRFVVTADDGVILDAWLSPAAAGVAKRMTVAISHGWLEIKEMHFPLAERLNRRGHDVILYDHRSHGLSGGDAATFGVMERKDLARVIDEAHRADIRVDRLVTLGFSLGGATVLQHAPTDPRVAGVIALAPFTDFRTAIGSFRSTLAPWMNHDWLMRGFEAATREAGFELDDASTVEAVRQLQAPVMLVEGGRDGTLPPDLHIRPLAEAMINGKVTLFTVADARHASLAHKRWPLLDEAVDQFIDALV